MGQLGATAELTGTVTSAGQALPGVTVTLTSNGLQGSRTTVTGENGGYLFMLVPPADYVLHFNLQGFTPAQEDVHVSLAETARADIALVPSPLREEIVVRAEGARLSDSSIGTNVDAALLQQLPGPRDIGAVTQLSPSTNRLGNRNGIVIDGAPSWDSLYLVDGVAASAYLTGQPHNVALEDAIQEIVVLSGGISAEYGRFTGGVVSTLTKSGGNAFSGSLRDTLTNAAWTARTPWPNQPRSSDRTNHALEATLGGFLIKERLWFFAASRQADNTALPFTNLTNIRYSSPSHDRRWEVKLTDHITSRQSLVLSYADAYLEEKNVRSTRGDNVLDLASLIADRTQPTRLLAATYNGTLTANAATEMQYSQKRYSLGGNGGLTNDPILGTLILVTGGDLNAPVGCGICGDDERDSKSLAAQTSIYRNTRWGNHTAVAGVEGFHETRTNAGTRSASEFNIVANSIPRFIGQKAYPVFGPATGIGWTQHFPNDRGSHLNTSSGYVSDRWEINRRSIVSLGLRYDRNHARDAAGRLFSNDAAWSPRLSATFDLRNDGRHQLLVAYGRYSAKILEAGGSPQQLGVFNELSWQYGGPTINGSDVPDGGLLPSSQALGKLFEWFVMQGGVQNRQFLTFVTTPDTSSVFHGPLQSPSVDEETVGYAVRLPHGYLRADYISRDWHHFYAARVDRTTGQTVAFGKTIDVAWVLNDNSETVRRYRALQLEGSWQTGSLRVGGGYVWSTLRGNDDEEGEAGFGPRNLPLSLWYPEMLGYPQRRPFGYLSEDERHRARVWIAYDRGPIALTLLQRIDSGHPYSVVGTFNPNTPRGFLPNPGYALNQISSGPYYFRRRGAFRTDDVFSTDLSMRYEVALRSARTFVKADVLNLLNNAAVVAPNTDVATVRNDPHLLAFNPFTQVPEEGRNYRLSSNFGKPTGPESYQPPPTFQIAIGARF